MARNRILQILRGIAAAKPSLSDGELYLEKDTSTLVVQNGSAEVRLNDQSTAISELQSDVSGIESTLAGMSPVQTGTGTLGTSWTGSGPYTQNVNISGMTSAAYPIVIPQWTASKEAEQTAWDLLTEVQSFNGYLRFTASAATTTAVNFAVKF